MFVMAECSVINFNKASIVRGHHVYKTVWMPFIGETLAVNCEEDNLHDRYAVTVYLNDSVVGHLSWSISQVSWFFLLPKMNTRLGFYSRVGIYF